MGNTSLAILTVAVVLIIWELTAIIFTNRKIRISAKVPGQRLGVGLFILLCLGILWFRFREQAWGYAAMGAVALAGVLNALMKNGFSDYGAYLNGNSTAYQNIRYYDVEERQGNYTRLRLSCLRREIVFLMDDSSLGNAVTMLQKNEVVDLETYKVLKRRHDEEEARRRESQDRGGKKKKKK